MIINQPVLFDGTPEERSINMQSHVWVSDGPEEAPICMHCDVKYWHRSAEYGCGVEVPREIVTTGKGEK